MQMKSSLVLGVVAVVWALPILFPPILAQPTTDFAVQVSASVQPDPPRIMLVWPVVENASGYSVSRKTRDGTTWGHPIQLPASATGYTDTDVIPGNAYEYHVSRTSPHFTGHGYIYAGIQAPLVETRGTLILIVDNTHASDLAAELTRLQQDLVGDGWEVRRHDTPRMAVDAANADPAFWAARSNEVAVVKQLIRSDYAADPANVRTVFLFGHVPVPYSGSFAPDAHLEHSGAWPADAYYGDMDGVWTDSTVINRGAADLRNQNVPRDGKFDQEYIPAKTVLELGRVDLANLPALPLSEVELLRRYLNKDHHFRHKHITAQPRALVNDNFSLLNGEVPAVNGWGNFAPLFGARNVTEGRWLTEFIREEYLWGYGCGPGTFTSAAGVVDTWHFIVYDTRVVFTMLFGSYFGDWDSRNNLLRAQLATPTYTLTSAWAGRPNWYVHHMAMGETIGFATRVTQNNAGLYQGSTRTNDVQIVGPGDPRKHMNQVHIALMGDPALRLHPVGPSLSLVALTNDSGGVGLSWEPSADAVFGYHIYRAPSRGGPYSRLNGTFLTGTNYTDPNITAARYYMVRAVKLEVSGSGSYFNASQGTFAEVSLPISSGNGGEWAGRGAGTWKFSDASGAAGSHPGWDCVKLDTALNVTATFANQFTVRVVSTDTLGAPDTPANFQKDLAYTWPILTAPAGIIGFDPGKVDLQTAEFTADLGGGVFKVELAEDGMSLNLVFTPNRPPSTGPAIFYTAWDTPLRIHIGEFLAQFTSDPDGDARTLVQIGSSTNGTPIFTDSNHLVFVSENNIRETVSYWVQDARPYRNGDTVRIVEGAITIQPIPVAPPSSAHRAVEIEWDSEAGKVYQVQFRLGTGSDWTDYGEPVVGTGEKMSIFERASTANKFYRVILPP